MISFRITREILHLRLRMELAICFCIILQNVCWLKLWAKHITIVHHFIYEFRHTVGIKEPERASTEWWKSDSKHRTDIFKDKIIYLEPEIH